MAFTNRKQRNPVSITFETGGHIRTATGLKLTESGKDSVGRFSTDTLIAIFLLLFCGVFLAASFTIRETTYASLGAEVWPRVILVFLSLLSLGYLVQSLRPGNRDDTPERPSFRNWLSAHTNAFWCFWWFGIFLATLPYLGMLLGGVLFVYATLTSLGRRDLRSHLVHAAIAVVSVAAMWSLFTYGLNVFLPEGTVFRMH